MLAIALCCLVLEGGQAEALVRLSLADAIAVALQGNLTLLDATDAVVAAEASEAAARAGFRPQVTPRLEHGRDERRVGLDLTQRIPWTGGTVQVSGLQVSQRANHVPTPHASSVAVSLSQPLLRGVGRTAASFDLDNARRARSAQERALVLSRQAIIVEVTSAYYTVVKQGLTEGVARQSLKRSQELARASAARMQVGLASKLDVLRAELQAAQAEAAVVAAETAKGTALERFRVLLGLDPGAAVEPEATALPEEEPEVPRALPELIATASEKRLDLQEARERIRDAERNLKVASLNLLPQLDLSVRASRVGTGGDFWGSVRGADTRAEAFVTASYPLQRATAAASREVARLGVDGSRRALQETERRVEADVRDRVRRLSALAQSIALQRRAVDVAEQQLRLASLRYERGLASNFDVIDAEGNLVAARTALVSLRSDYWVAVVDLRRATGELEPAEAVGREPSVAGEKRTK